MKIKVYRGNSEVLELPLETGVFTCEKMGVHELVFALGTTKVLDLQIGDFVIYKNEVMKMNYTPTYTNKGAHDKSYNITFEGRRATLYDQPLVDEGDVTFSYFGTPSDLLNLIISNINSLDAGWSIGGVDDAAPQSFEFDNVSCFVALNTIAQKFGLEWQITQRVITLKKNIGVVRSVTLKQGRGNGLYSLTREYLKDSNIVTRAYALGSTNNLPPSYGGKRLSLPDYVEANTDRYGVKVKYYTFDDVFPKRTGTASGVGKINDKTYTLTDGSINFDINGQRAGENDVKIVFKSGALNGQEFVITKYNHLDKTITYKANEDANGGLIPFSATIAAVGDQYTLVGLIMPDAYIESAKDILRQRRAEALAKDSVPKVVYSLQSDVLFLKKNGLTLSAGDIVRVKDDSVGLDELLTVQKVSHPAIFPAQLAKGMQFTAEVGNTSYSKIQDRIYNAVQNQIQINGETRRNTLEIARQNAAQLRELKNYLFDADDYFDPTHIKPQSIETQMLAVGARSQNFLLVGVNMEANYLGNANAFNVTGGKLQHLEVSIGAGFVWELNPQNFVNLDPTKAYYLAAKCNKNQLIGTYNLSTTPYKVEEQEGFYNFQIGVLYPEKDAKRTFYATAGVVTIIGDQIKGGRMVSNNGALDFDLNNGVLRADNFTFTSAQKSDLISGVEVGGRNYYSNSQTTINPYALYAPDIIKNTSESPNGFTLTGNQTRDGNLRLQGVISSNGFWTVSGYVRGTQNVEVNFKIDICDLHQKYFKSNPDNSWTYFTHTVEVNNYSTSYNFVDFSEFDWVFYRFKNIKIEKGNRATDWTPAPEDVEADAQARATAAQNAAIATAATDAQQRAATAQQAALAAAKAYTEAQDNLRKTEMLAYADGVVTAEEQARINADAQAVATAAADAQAKAEAARQAAVATAAVDAQSRVDSVQVGGRNLVLKSDTPHAGVYWLQGWDLSEPITTGKYTITLEYETAAENSAGLSFGKSGAQADRTAEYIWHFQIPVGSGKLSQVVDVNYGDARKGLFIYVNAQTTIKRIKVEKGNTPTDWTPAPEDLTNQIGNLSASGRNLMLNSKSISGYQDANIIAINSDNWRNYSPFTEAYRAGQRDFTITLRVKATKAGWLNNLRVIYQNSSNWTKNYKMNSQDVGADWSIVNCSFTVSDGMPLSVDIVLYLNKQDGLGSLTVDWVTIYSGNIVNLDWIPAPEDVEAEFQAVKSTAQTLANKTNFLAETQISGNNVATGVLQVGNNFDGANAFISGFGAYAFGAGASFANGANAPFRVTRQGDVYMRKAIIESRVGTTQSGFTADNGVMTWTDNQGRKRMQIGFVDNVPTFTIFAATGEALLELGAQGLYQVNYVQESWSLRQLFKLSQTSQSINVQAAQTEVYNAVVKSSTKNPFDGSGVQTWRIVYKLNSNANAYFYSAGSHPNTAQYKSYEGYKSSGSPNRTTNIADGWYGLDTGTLYDYYNEVEASTSHTFAYALVYIQGGKVVQSQSLQITK